MCFLLLIREIEKKEEEGKERKEEEKERASETQRGKRKRCGRTGWTEPCRHRTNIGQSAPQLLTTFLQKTVTFDAIPLFLDLGGGGGCSSEASLAGSRSVASVGNRQLLPVPPANVCVCEKTKPPAARYSYFSLETRNLDFQFVETTLWVKQNSSVGLLGCQLLRSQLYTKTRLFPLPGLYSGAKCSQPWVGNARWPREPAPVQPLVCWGRRVTQSRRIRACEVGDGSTSQGLGLPPACGSPPAGAHLREPTCGSPAS